MLPMSLQKLLQETEYPPQRPALMQSSTNRVSMIVDTVSPTPFALLRRANHFQYREDDRALREYAEYEDPVSALTEECRRVLRSVSATNQSKAVSSSKHSTSLRDASWSRFEDIGFASALEEEDEEDDTTRMGAPRRQQGLRSTAASGGLGRPTTPSWADFLSSGFVDEKGHTQSNLLLPPDKVLPPIETAVRQRSSQAHRPRLESETHQLEPGELASTTRFDLDDAFWWVWMSSLGPEETPDRKAAFGRCAVIETVIRTGRWLVIEELVKGAAPDLEDGAYIAEKKSFFSWTRRNKSGLSRRKSTGKHALDRGDGLKPSSTMGFSKTSIGPDQQAKIQAAAMQLQMKEKQRVQQQQQQVQERRGRNDSDLMAEKTNSVLTLQPSIMTEASPAVKWANKYDKEAIREAYLLNANLGRGSTNTNGHATPLTNGHDHPPELPPKSPAQTPQPPIATLPTSSSFGISRAETPEPELPHLTEKAIEAPRDTHPLERASDVGRNIPLPPPKEAESMELARGTMELARETMVSPDLDLSPESKKQRKLHKEMNKTAANASGAASGGGLRKLFARKNRQSKLPENAANQLSAMTSQTEKAAAPEPTSAPTPVPQPLVVEQPPLHHEEVEERYEPVSPPSPPVVAPAFKVPVAPVMPPVAEPMYEPTFEPPVHEDTTSSAAAAEEFARFDQGPLLDQPAFLPDGDDADDAVPPPIARHTSRSPLPSPTADDDEAAPAPPPVARAVPAVDRWAQIRKNAAERAAQRQAGGPVEEKKPIEVDDDTSGEESKLTDLLHEWGKKRN